MNNCLDRRVFVVPLSSRFRASRRPPALRIDFYYHDQRKKKKRIYIYIYIELETTKTLRRPLCRVWSVEIGREFERRREANGNEAVEISWISELLLNVKVAHLQLFCVRDCARACACVCIYICERACTRTCACVIVCVWERKKGRKKGRKGEAKC